MRPEIYALDRMATAIGALELCTEPVAQIRLNMLLNTLQNYVLFSSAAISRVRSRFTTLLT